MITIYDVPLKKFEPDLKGLDDASGLSDNPLDCIRRIKALFHAGTISSDNEPDSSGLEYAYTLLLTEPLQGLNALKVLAERGSIMSALYIAEAYRKGLLGNVDIAESVEWYRNASAKGSIFGYYRLGRIYLRLKEYTNAKECFEVCISTKFIPAISIMGYMYAYGLGVRKDWNRARELLENASEQGHILAKGFLASLLIRGHWGWFQVFRGIWLECLAIKEAAVTDSNDICRM